LKKQNGGRGRDSGKRRNVYIEYGGKGLSENNKADHGKRGRESTQKEVRVQKVGHSAVKRRDLLQ